MTRDEWLAQMRADANRLALLIENPTAPLDPPPSEWVPTGSVVDEARGLAEWCTDRKGVVSPAALHRLLNDLISQRNSYMVRLGLLWPVLFEDIAPTAATTTTAEEPS